MKEPYRAVWGQGIMLVIARVDADGQKPLISLRVTQNQSRTWGWAGTDFHNADKLPGSPVGWGLGIEVRLILKNEVKYNLTCKPRFTPQTHSKHAFNDEDSVIIDMEMSRKRHSLAGIS